MARPRLVDVANEAGVSIGAASDALSGKNRIPEATRQRVRQAAEKLGYVPNAAARALGSGHLPILGLVLDVLRRPVEFESKRSVWADVIRVGSLAAAERGYLLAVIPGLDDARSLAVPLAGLIVISSGWGTPAFDSASFGGLPVLIVPDGDSIGARVGELITIIEPGFDGSVVSTSD